MKAKATTMRGCSELEMPTILAGKILKQ